MIIEHLAINVADAVAMTDWYVKHLRMKIIRQVDGPPYTRFLADEAGRVVLEIYQQSAPVPDYASMDPMTFHIAFVASDVDAECHRLVAAGATMAMPPAAAANGDVLAMLRDPWGVCIQLAKRSVPLLG
ncbi:MAG: hypothetical protein KatS3mg105_2319 [Gemmatales bacterium]|nr:MAG: hypothetical protein KatS3mg105_2319 [Gemmatales bacterium]